MKLLLWVFLSLQIICQVQELPPDYSPLSTDDLKAVEQGETVQFQSDVSRVMSIIINSIYKSKEVFLRELLSNAADALDKIRFLSLTNKKELESQLDLKIQILPNKEQKTLTIRDTGIGMDQKTLKSVLGTVAKSGTAEFMKAVQNETDLIGQFGVGFYSAFLVADKVTVVSKHNEDVQWIWESTSENDFRMLRDPRGNTLGRGTEIILHLKPDALEYLDDTRLRQLVQTYSEFINFPIYVWSTKEIEEQVEDSNEIEDDVEDVTEPKTTTIKRIVTEWELVNENKPIWTRPLSQVTVEEYQGFYKSLFKDNSDPLAYSHFKAEGDVDFKSIVYIPKNPPKNFMEPGQKVEKNIKVFVKKVFVTELSDFMPKWLSFVKVLIDSPDLPLSVSRETLQKHPSLKRIRKKVVGKTLDLLVELAQNPDKSVYSSFYKQYRSAIKYGVFDARGPSQKKLVKLLRYESTVSPDTSFQEYVDRMKDKQPQIYYVTASNIQEAKNSPLVETLVARGYEVLFFVDPVDEYLTGQALNEFEGFPLQNAGKDGLKFGDEEENEKKAEALEAEFKPLTEWLQKQLESDVQQVRLSKHLTSSFGAVIPGPMGLSAAQERLLGIQAQSKGEMDPMGMFYKSQKRVFELNPNHPLIKSLLTNVKNEKTDALKHVPKALFEASALHSGWEPRSPSEFVNAVEKLLRVQVGVDEEAKAETKVEKAKDKTEKKERVEEDLVIELDLDEHDEL
ncbi:Hsp90 protein-domain-containing protein [Gorgonomyces haynaldii]|nr:Hsp90 protein-domain-containing protein [Gorgonomyces haynaldii]